MKFEGIYKIHKNSHEVTNRCAYFEINSEEISSDMTDDDLFGLYMDIMYDDFDGTVSPKEENLDKFIEWAKENKLVEDV